MSWCPSYYPYCCPVPYTPCYFGGCYNDQPYYTQFRNEYITLNDVRRGKYPSANLTHGAAKMSGNLRAGMGACGEMICHSKELSCDAEELGEKFAVFTHKYAEFSNDARKFMTGIKYPDIEEAIKFPKPTFDETCVWSNMNEDFDRQIGCQEFLRVPPECCQDPTSCQEKVEEDNELDWVVICNDNNQKKHAKTPKSKSKNVKK